MLFNSLTFLVYFLPATLLVFYLVPPTLRLWVLAIASGVFYGFSGLVPLLFMYAGVVWAYVIARFTPQLNRKVAVVLSVSFPLIVLFLFKYFDFMLGWFGTNAKDANAFDFITNIVLPAGISFYTFQIIAYSIDVIDGKVEADKSLLRFTTYISLFPQLIAGPILRYSDIHFQLLSLTRVEKLKPDLVTGLKLISIGLFAKVFVADFFSSLADQFKVLTNTSSPDAIFVTLSYSFQIYYDFWAYSVIAIGLSKLFCLDMPINFDEPYLSLNPKEFWRRWHITLSYWLRDYVYLRLGGNKAYAKNIAIVFIAVGLWHGAGWNFVLWGALHGLFVLTYVYVLRRGWDVMPRALQISINFAIVSLMWPLFFHNIGEYWLILQQIFSFSHAGVSVYGPSKWAMMAAIAVFTFGARERYWFRNSRPLPIADWALVHASLFFMSVLFISWSKTFVYFRF